MKLAISNIAWRNEDEREIADLLERYEVKGIEIAPTAIWPRPLDVSREEVQRYRTNWAKHGIAIVSMQAILFGRPELELFGTAQVRRELRTYLDGIFRLASWLEAGPLVFGAPKNRRVGACTPDEQQSIACDFFAEVGAAAENHGVVLCLEPNPPEYECDFVNTTAEARALVTAVGSAGFALHLDTAAMSMVGDPPAAILAPAPAPRHVHISEPFLGAVEGQTAVDHGGYATALRDLPYAGWCAVEMRNDGAGSVARVARALTFVRKVYGDGVES